MHITLCTLQHAKCAGFKVQKIRWQAIHITSYTFHLTHCILNIANLQIATCKVASCKLLHNCKLHKCKLKSWKLQSCKLQSCKLQNCKLQSCKLQVEKLHVASCKVASSKVASCKVANCKVASKSVAICKVLKLQVAKLYSCKVTKCKVASCNVESCKVLSNIASAKWNFELGYAPTHRRTSGLLELLSQLKTRALYLSWLKRGGPMKFENTFFQIAKLRFSSIFVDFRQIFLIFKKISGDQFKS